MSKFTSDIEVLRRCPICRKPMSSYFNIVNGQWVLEYYCLVHGQQNVIQDGKQYTNQWYSDLTDKKDEDKSDGKIH